MDSSVMTSDTDCHTTVGPYERPPRPSVPPSSPPRVYPDKDEIVLLGSLHPLESVTGG